MKIKLFTVFVLFLSFAVFAGAPEQESPFSVTISTLKSEYVVAEPVCIRLTLKNISKETIKFSAPHTAVDHGHNLSLLARSDEGLNSGFSSEYNTYFSVRSELQNLQNDGSCTLAPGAVYELTSCAPINWRSAPSTWEIWAEFSGRGSFVPVILVMPGAPPQKQLCEGCWKGSVQSNRITVRFTEPVAGADQSANDGLIKPFLAALPTKGGSLTMPFRDVALIKDYPESVYATWARFVQIQSAMHLYCGSFMREPNGLKYLPMRRASYSPQHRDEVAKSEKSRAPYLIEQCRFILRNHPNLEPVASVTRVNLAALLYITGDTPGATEQLCFVIKSHPDWDEGKAAKQMLEVISAPLPQQAPAPLVVPPPPAAPAPKG